MSNLANAIENEDRLFLTLLHPYNDVDDLFFSLFRSFPLAMIPTDVQELIDFKENLQELLTLAEIKEVDVQVQTRNATKVYTIRSLQDFEMSLEILETLAQTETPDLPGTGNFWGIRDQHINYVGIDEKYVDVYNKVTDNVYQPFGHSYDLDSVDINEDPKLVLPKSGFDQAHNIKDPKGLRIMDRVAKYGESFPFLNEDGSLTEAANADILELMMLEASDNDLLSFISNGIDAVSNVGGKLADGISKIADGAERAYKGASKVAKDTADAVGKGIEKYKEHKKEKADKASKDGAIEAMEKADNELDKVDPLRVAKETVDKEPGPATEDKQDAFTQANNAIAAAKKAGEDYQDLKNHKEEVSSDIRDKVREERAARSKKDSEESN